MEKKGTVNPSVDEKKGHKVELYVYDLSHGMAKMMSQSFLGKQIDGIWHTGIVVYGHEYFYGGGIQSAAPGKTMAGRPHQVHLLGYTQIPQSTFHDFLQSISSDFTPQTYSLLKHNCNNFTSACSKFLLDTDIPDYIIGLPEDALNTPMGQMFRPMIEQFESQMKGSVIPWQEADASGQLSSLYLPPINPQYEITFPNNATTTANGSSSSSSSTTSTVGPKSSSTSSFIPPLDNGIDGNKIRIFDELKQKSFAQLIQVMGLKIQELCCTKSKFVSTDAAAADFKSLGFELTADEIKCVKALGKVETVEAMIQVPLALETFDRLMNKWPVNAIFPVYGVFRTFILNTEVAKRFHSELTEEVSSSVGGGDSKTPHCISILKHLTKFLTTATFDYVDSVPYTTRMLALQSLCNMFAYAPLGKHISQEEHVVDAATQSITSNQDVRVRRVAASLLLNISLSLPDNDLIPAEIAALLSQKIVEEEDAETVAILLSGMFHLSKAHRSAAQVLKGLEFDAQAAANRFPSEHRKTFHSVGSQLTDLLAKTQIEE